MNTAQKLHDVLSFVKRSFVGKDEVIDLLGVSLIARENAFLLGPPGTAKSAIIRLLSNCLAGAKNFEYLLTRFTEPSEIFGPFDIRRLKEGELVTNTAGMLPEASLVFLDELFNANSAILNSLLMSLNERVFRRGQETKSLPALMFVGASNALPEDDALGALLDRFLIRVRCDYVDPGQLEEVLMAGWNFENDFAEERPTVGPDEVRQMQQAARRVDLSAVRREYVALVHHLRNAGIHVSDRRAVKIQHLLAASALLSGRTEAVLSDLWVLKYVWDTEEQIEVLAGIVDQAIEKEPHPLSHPQALRSQAPDAEELMKEITGLRQRWNDGALTLAEQNLIKDKLRYLQTRSHWIIHHEHQQYIQTEIETLWHQILQTL